MPAVVDKCAAVASKRGIKVGGWLDQARVDPKEKTAIADRFSDQKWQSAPAQHGGLPVNGPAVQTKYCTFDAPCPDQAATDCVWADWLAPCAHVPPH